LSPTTAGSLTLPNTPPLDNNRTDITINPDKALKLIRIERIFLLLKTQKISNDTLLTGTYALFSISGKNYITPPFTGQKKIFGMFTAPTDNKFLNFAFHFTVETIRW
jgi:hypothetical protein